MGPVLLSGSFHDPFLGHGSYSSSPATVLYCERLLPSPTLPALPVTPSSMREPTGTLLAWEPRDWGGWKPSPTARCHLRCPLHAPRDRSVPALPRCWAGQGGCSSDGARNPSGSGEKEVGGGRDLTRGTKLRRGGAATQAGAGRRCGGCRVLTDGVEHPAWCCKPAGGCGAPEGSWMGAGGSGCCRVLAAGLRNQLPGQTPRPKGLGGGTGVTKE